MPPSCAGVTMIRAMRSLLVLCVVATLGAHALSAAAQELPVAIDPSGIRAEPLFEAAFPPEAIPEILATT